MKKLLLYLLSMLLLSNIAKSQIVINEYSCANLDDFADSYGKYEDWVELYNTSGTSISIGGYYLSDDTLTLTKWQIPTGLSLPGYGYIRIWCSGRNTGTTFSNLHTNFKLTQTKDNSERICLSSPSGILIDKEKIDKTKLGHSRGLISDGDTTWGIYTTPTPASSNNPATYYTAYSNRPQVNMTPGHYAGSVTVTLSNMEPTSTTMRYTLNGSAPTATSAIYTGPITISTTSVLKATAFSNDATILSSFIEYNTYFINVSHTLPIVSISGTQLQALADGDETLRPHGSIEYFSTTGERSSKSYGEYNSHGQDSWANDQRSIDFVARDEMGYSSGLKEKLFWQKERDKFQRIILRAAGDDNYPAAHHEQNEGSAHLRDAFFQNLCLDGGVNLDTRTAAKCIVYLNGQYWGVFDLREIPDDHDYTKYYYNQDKYNLEYVLTWGSTWAEYGGTAAITNFNSTRDFILANDMTIPSNWAIVDAQFDVKSLADYVIVHSLSVSSDWLNYNTGIWRGLNPDGEHKKWGYILWDNDASFAFYINYTGIDDTSATAPVCQVEDITSPWSDPQGHIEILNKLLTNPEYRDYYITRYADIMNTFWSCDYMLTYLDSVKNIIEPEMEMHTDRWFGTYDEWHDNYERLRYFISRRCGTTAGDMSGCYSLTGPYDVVFNSDPAYAGSMNINSLSVTDLPWNASYFGGIDIDITAVPVDAVNMPFINWTSNTGTLTTPTSLSDVLHVSANDSVTAHYNIISTVPVIGNMHYTVDAAPSVFSDMTHINFTLPEPAQVQMQLYDMAGKMLVDFTPGTMQFNKGVYRYALDFNNTVLSKGAYLLEYKANNFNKTIKLIYQ